MRISSGLLRPDLVRSKFGSLVWNLHVDSHKCLLIVLTATEESRSGVRRSEAVLGVSLGDLGDLLRGLSDNGPLRANRLLEADNRARAIHTLMEEDSFSHEGQGKEMKCGDKCVVVWYVSNDDGGMITS